MSTSTNKKKTAFKFLLLFGVISALGDITYDGVVIMENSLKMLYETVQILLLA